MNGITEGVVLSIMVVIGVLLSITLCIGTAVAVRPQWLDSLRQAGGRLSLRRATRVLDAPRNIDHIFYRYHRAYGAVVIALAIFLLYFLSFVEVGTGWSNVLGIQDEEVLAMLGTWARFILWIFAIFALMIGTIVFVRPSALKNLEQWANRWLTPRFMMRSIQSENYFIDRGASARPRLWGVTVAVVSLISLTALYVQWKAALAGA